MNHRGIGLPAMAMVLLADGSRRTRKHIVSSAEERIFRLFNAAPDSLHIPAWVVMQSGSLAAVFVTAAELARRGRVRDARVTFVTGLLVWGGVKLVKPSVGRGRPQVHLEGVSVRGQAQTGLGFPSGHTAVALHPGSARDACPSSPAARAAALAVAATAAGARMYVGAHLPLDIAGGAAIGVIAARAAEEIAYPPKFLS